MATRRTADLETQLKEIRRQLSDQLACLDFRVESKLSLLSEFQEFFKRRGEVEYEYARSLERLCERFEKSTKQRNIRTEVRSTFNLWSTLLAETRKMSRERASFAEVLASEMVTRLEIMVKDVHTLAKKCKDMCVDVQDQFLKELRDFGEQTKVYQISCHNTNEAYNKLVKTKEKRDAIRGSGARRKRAQEKEMDRQRHYKAQRHLLMKNRNDYILGITKCNSFAMQYFNMDIMDVVEYMDFDYHTSFQRLASAYREAEREAGEAVLACADNMVEQGKGLNFETDLRYFLSEYAGAFTPPNPFIFTSFPGDDVKEYKVNTEDVFQRAKRTVDELVEQRQTLEIQREEDVKTVAHMVQVNLKKYQITSVDDALAVLEENGDSMPSENLKDSRGSASLDRGLSLSTRSGHAIQLSQKGKKDTLFFTLQVVQRRILRSDRLALVYAQLDILEKSLDEQKVPPVSVVVDAHGHSIPGEVPKLFGGNCLDYIMATGCGIPLIVQSCVRAIEREGLRMEGLFRVPGPAAHIEELRKGFEEGRDPLATSINKVDMAAVASVLKGYFRELSVPLFPTDDYAKFIKCTRIDDPQVRIDAIRDTVNYLHPAIVTVMRFLFKFLYKVAQYSSDNKMGSANLALVFGPTLTRAPDELDPRQLTNDVPAINMLIQVCIDRYDYVFGEEDDEEEALREGSTSPPPQPPTPPPEYPAEPSITAPPLPKRVPLEHDVGTEDKVEAMEQPTEAPPHPPMQLQPPTLTEPTTIGEPQEAAVTEEKEEEGEPQPMALVTQPVSALPPLAVPEYENGMHRQGSGTSLSRDLSTLDETLKDLESFQASLQLDEGVVDEGWGEGGGRGGREGGGAKEGGGFKRILSEGGEDEEDEEESSDEEGVMTIEAVAIYDYTARSDKELSFQRGELLHVNEKTPDSNWWDGFHGSRRGFIPVAYVEIKELHMPAPAPPLRKSSMPSEEHEALITSPKVVEPPQAIAEEDCRELVTPEMVMSDSSTERVTSPEDVLLSPEVTSPTEVFVEPSSSPEPSKPSEEANEPPKPAGVPESPKKPPVPVSVGAVKSLTQQFQETQQRVLVEPHHHHRRQASDVPGGVKKPSDQDNLSRSASGGNKVSMLSSAFQQKPAPPPPVRPKPHSHPALPPPSHPMSPQQGDAGVFPVIPHGQLPGASPLQKAALVSQVGTAPPRKPAPPPTMKPAAAKPTKSSFKVKRERSKKEDKRPSIPAKPTAAHPYPPPLPADRTQELVKEMMARRKAQEDHN